MEKKLEEREASKFRYNFHVLRTKRKLEQKELAEKMGLNQQDISAIEHNRKRITASLIKSAAAALETTEAELLAEVELKVSVDDISMRLMKITEKLYRTNLDYNTLEMISKSVDVLEAIIVR